MLPLNNSLSYSDDLVKMPFSFRVKMTVFLITMTIFLFYAEGIDTWNAESLTSVNLFADRSYYYVTSSGGAGKEFN